jgi:hypothetical protein
MRGPAVVFASARLHTLTVPGSCPHTHALRQCMVGDMTEKKRAAGRKLIRVDEGILRLAAAELVRRATQEVTESLTAGTVKVRGFGSKDAARPSRAQATRRRRPRGRGQHG